MPRDDRRQEAAQPVIHSSFSSIPRIIVASCLPTLVSLPPAFVTPLTTLTSFLNLRYERPEGTSWETNKGSDKTRVGRVEGQEPNRGTGRGTDRGPDEPDEVHREQGETNHRSGYNVILFTTFHSYPPRSGRDPKESERNRRRPTHVRRN